MIKRKLKIFETPHQLAEEIVNQLIIELDRKLGEKFCLVISGGSTPKILFELLATEKYSRKINWDKLHFYWADERCVPPDDSESNYGTTKKLLFDIISINEKNIHRIKGEYNPEKEAGRYADEIEKNIPKKNNLPQFDWILLGMGEDGHTASLFPNQNLIKISRKIIGTAVHPKSGQARISMTEDLINNSLRVTFLVTGKEKAETLKEIFQDEKSINKYPAAKIHSIKNVSEWYLDKKAGKYL